MPQQLEYVEDDSGWDKDFVPQPIFAAANSNLWTHRLTQKRIDPQVGAHDQGCQKDQTV